MRKIAVVVLALGVTGSAQTHRPMVGAKMWNDVFTELALRKEPVQPNPFLLKTVDGMKPGSALDIGMGQGRNALMLAAHGWSVTGFDISDVAVGQARAQAQQRGLKLNAIVADADTFDYGVGRYDLIAEIYVQGGLSDEKTKTVLRSLKRGGTLVIEGFHRDALPVGYENNELPRTLGSALTILYYEDAVGKPDGTWKDAGGKDLRFVRFIGRKG